MRETKTQYPQRERNTGLVLVELTCVLNRGLSVLSAGERRVGASTGAVWAAAQGPGAHCCGAVSGLPSCSCAAGPGPGDSVTLSLFLLKEAPEARSKDQICPQTSGGRDALPAPVSWGCCNK